MWDDQSMKRMWDFCLVDSRNGHAASVEVTRVTDPALRRLWDLIERAGGTRWDAPAHLQAWQLGLSHDTTPTKISRDSVFELLADAQAAGVTLIHRSKPDIWHERDLALGISEATCFQTTTGATYVAGPGTAWSGDGYVTSGVVAEARENREKLRAAPAPRHLFVWIEGYAIPAAFELRDGMGAQPVTLPDYVDVAWVSDSGFGAMGSVLWRATDGQPWQQVAGQ